MLIPGWLFCKVRCVRVRRLTEANPNTHTHTWYEYIPSTHI